MIATRNAGIPEHLGEDAVWIDSDNSQQIVEQVERLLGSDQLRRDLSNRLRRRAEQDLNWDAVARRTLEVYDRALRRNMN